MFKKFLNSLKNDNNAALIESIQQAYKACFETAVEYSAIDPFTGMEKNYFGISADSIPLQTADPEEARRQILEEWQKIRNPSDRELEFLIAHKPKALVNNEYSVLLTTNNSVWNQLRKMAETIYPDRIKAIQDRMYDQSKHTMKNQNANIIKNSETLNPVIFKNQERLHQNRLRQLDKGFKQFAKQELKA